ncbi:hypothetical protein CL620_05060 [archaeon]|jgi:hypothetical protein|nr:hypothetical protein [archaeon]|tara:strand:- start:923 stop:1342 length:420 start_codon:yes stop_codon:yes gene_type:complete
MAAITVDPAAINAAAKCSIRIETVAVEPDPEIDALSILIAILVAEMLPLPDRAHVEYVSSIAETDTDAEPEIAAEVIETLEAEHDKDPDPEIEDTPMRSPIAIIIAEPAAINAAAECSTRTTTDSTEPEPDRLADAVIS